MSDTLVGLERVEFVRPREYAGQVEVQSGAPGVRRWPTRMCEGFELSLLIGPTHEATIQGRRTETPGKVTFVQLPGTVWSAERVSGAFLSVEVAPALFARFVDEWPWRTSLPGPSQVVLPALLDAFWSAYKVLRSESDTLARSEALVRLVSLALAGMTWSGPTPPTVPDALSRVRDAIHDCPMKALTIEVLAAQAGTTPFELVRAFQHRYGLGPSAYRRALRLARARRMLFGGRSSEEVAAELGFSSTMELRRSFLAQIGLEPERYRAGVD